MRVISNKINLVWLVIYKPTQYSGSRASNARTVHEFENLVRSGLNPNGYISAIFLRDC
jgi:hypothetical protein